MTSRNILLEYNKAMKAAVDIILPAYHEQENIAAVIAGINKEVKAAHNIKIILQDRKDPTFPVIKKLQKKNRRIKVYFTPDGVGLAKALKTGFQKVTTPLVVEMMSDSSDDPSSIDRMIKKINRGYDLVCASRNIRGGKRLHAPLLKKMLSFGGSVSLQYLTGLKTSDATNAFKCFRRDLLKEIKLESNRGFELPLELTVKAHYLGKKIGEVPTVWRERKNGNSHFKIFNLLPHYLRWYFWSIEKNVTRMLT